MIKCDNGVLSFGGSKLTLYADLATIMHALLHKGIFTEKDLDDCLADAKMTEEQLDKAMKDQQDLTAGIISVLDQIFGDLFKDLKDGPFKGKEEKDGENKQK